MSITIKNLESALAGESMAHIKYRYFAKIARAEGFEDVAKHFEHTADQELLHAWGHLELLVGKPSTKKPAKVRLTSLQSCIQTSNEKLSLKVIMKQL